jgi:benzoate/toluate 1,2-dioxygenase reductase component
VTRLSETTLQFALAVDPSVELSFLPGQYVNIRVPDTDQKRSYSFSSTPGGNAVSFLIRDIPRGQMSTFLRERGESGAAMEFTGPSGTFYLRDINRPLLLLAGGTGLAPFLSMLGKIAQTGSAYPIHMIYGVTNVVDLVGVDQLEAYTRAIPNFSFGCCVASESSDYPNKGYVTRYIEPAHLNGGNVDVYLCGPPPMVDAVRHFLTEQSVAPANFYFEKFSPSGAVTAIGETHRAAS